MDERDQLVRFLKRLDERHLAYARAYAEELALAEPAPSSAGLDRRTVREVRRLVWREWRRRIASMGSSASSAGFVHPGVLVASLVMWAVLIAAGYGVWELVRWL